MSISELLSTTSESPLEASFCAQLQAIKQRETKGGKPFLEWTIADSTGNLTLKVWNNHPQFDAACELDPETLIHIHGQWTQNQYGVDGMGLPYWSPAAPDPDANSRDEWKMEAGDSISAVAH